MPDNPFTRFICKDKIREIERLNRELKATEKTLKDKVYLIEAHNLEKARLHAEIDREASLKERYMNLWKAGLHIPNIKNYVKKHTVYDPWGDHQLAPYERLIADIDYHAYPKKTWTSILKRIHKEVKDEVPRWIKEVSDCDDFSDVMSTAVYLAFIDAGKRRQGAFGIAHSRTHAYNFYVDEAEQIWIYEPQNGETIGKLGETPEPYGTLKLLFIG